MTGKLTSRLDDLSIPTHARKRVHPKAYLLTDFVVNGQKLSTMTEGELGNHHMLHSYHRMIMDYSVARNQQEIREEDLPLVPNIDKPSIC